jgi:hypothetical protein
MTRVKTDKVDSYFIAEYGRKILYMAALSGIRFNKYCRIIRKISK